MLKRLATVPRCSSQRWRSTCRPRTRTGPTPCATRQVHALQRSRRALRVQRGGRRLPPHQRDRLHPAHRDQPVDTAQTASGKLSYALSHAASGNDGLYISRTAPFTGHSPWASGLRDHTALGHREDGAAPVDGSGDDLDEYVLNGSTTPSGYPRLYLYNNSAPRTSGMKSSRR